MPNVEKSLALKIALGIGLLEMIGIVIYAITIGAMYLSQGTSGAVGSDVSPWVLIATYFGFAGLILLVLLRLNSGSGAARTPYLLTQAFAIVIAQALINGSEKFEIGLGWALVAIGILGAVSMLTPAASKNLNINK